MARLGYLYVGIAAIVLVALSAIWLSGFGSSSAYFVDGHTADGFPEKIEVANDYFGTCTQRDAGVGVRILLRKMDETSGKVNADVSVCVSDARMLELIDSGSQRRVAVSRNGVPVVRDEYQKAKFSLTINSSFSGRVQQRSISLGAMASDNVPGYLGDMSWTDAGQLELDLNGNPRDFPLDDYVAEYTIDFELPPRMLGVREEDRSTSVGWAVDHIEIVKSAEFSPREVKASKAGSYGILSLVISRGKTTIGFVVLVLTLPLLLALALLTLALMRVGVGASIEIMIGSAAVLVALLPIRAVLVPREIQSLSLVDYTIGVQIALLTLVATIAAAATIKRVQANQKPAAEPSGPVLLVSAENSNSTR